MGNHIWYHYSLQAHLIAKIGRFMPSNKPYGRITTNNNDCENTWLRISTPVPCGVLYACCTDGKLIRRDDISWEADNWWRVTRVISCHWPSPFHFPGWLTGICAGQHIIRAFYGRWLVVLTNKTWPNLLEKTFLSERSYVTGWGRLLDNNRFFPTNCRELATLNQYKTKARSVWILTNEVKIGLLGADTKVWK